MTAMMDALSGSTTRRKKAVSLQPSRSAASRSSSGMVCWKKVRVTIRFQVLTAPGRIRAHMVL